MSIHYHIYTENVDQHLFAIELTIKQPDKTGQIVYLPNWIKGSYLIRDFAKHIVQIKASNKKTNKLLAIKQLDKNHWQVARCQDTIVICYQVYAFDLSVRGAYLSQARGFFNGNSVFLGVAKKEKEKHQVSITAYKNWSIYTALPHINTSCYQSDDYEHLLDCPVEMGNHLCFDFTVNQIKHRLVISGTRQTFASKRLLTDIKKICQHHHSFFQTAPFDDYLFLLHLTHDSYGGLEHRNSTALIGNRDSLPQIKQKEKSDNYVNLLALFAHEYFHAWWVKAIEPKAFKKVNLNNEAYSEQLWIFEGFTSYYDELTLLRTKQISLKRYLSLFSKNINRLQQHQGRHYQTLAQSSFQAWTKLYQANENSLNHSVSYYAKGAILAFLLDIEIRKQNNHQQSLDSVVRYIWQHHQKQGLNDDTLISVINNICQNNINDFWQNYLYQTKELPLASTYQYLGIKLTFKGNENSLNNLGIAIEPSQTLAKIMRISNELPAQKAGLYVGDTIIAINSEKTSTENINKILENYHAGNTITIHYFRDNQLNKCQLTLGSQLENICQLTANSAADKKTKKHRDLWQLGS